MCEGREVGECEEVFGEKGEPGYDDDGGCDKDAKEHYAEGGQASVGGFGVFCHGG